MSCERNAEPTSHTPAHMLWTQVEYNACPCAKFALFAGLVRLFVVDADSLLFFFRFRFQITCHQSFNSSNSNDDKKIETIFQIVSKMASFRQCVVFHEVHAMHIPSYASALADNFQNSNRFVRMVCVERTLSYVRRTARNPRQHRYRRQAAFRHISLHHIFHHPPTINSIFLFLYFRKQRWLPLLPLSRWVSVRGFFPLLPTHMLHLVLVPRGLRLSFEKKRLKIEYHMQNMRS